MDNSKDKINDKDNFDLHSRCVIRVVGERAAITLTKKEKFFIFFKKVKNFVVEVLAFVIVYVCALVLLVITAYFLKDFL